MDLKNTNNEVLHFVAKRLLNYKRINYDILLETIKIRFPKADADELLTKALIETNAAMLENEHITLSDPEALLKTAGLN